MPRSLCCLLLLAVACGGCSRRQERFVAPEVDANDAAAKAMELYDANGDDALSQEELAKCPGVLAKVKSYDANGNGSVEKDEFASHLGKLLNGTGGTQLSAVITHKGRPLSGAEVLLEPEPYLGDQVQAAKGVTDGAGTTDLAIPSEFVPEHLRRLKTVHYGTFKVRITHPSIQLPPKYNAETELGYETEPGNPYVRFNLN